MLTDEEAVSTIVEHTEECKAIDNGFIFSLAETKQIGRVAWSIYLHSVEIDKDLDEALKKATKYIYECNIREYIDGN